MVTYHKTWIPESDTKVQQVQQAVGENVGATAINSSRRAIFWLI